MCTQLVNVSTYLHDPTHAEQIEPTINAAITIECITATSEGSSMGLQIAQTLFVLAIDDARAQPGHAAYSKGGPKVGQICKGNFHFVLVLHTSAAAAEAVK